jgi:uncharacterized protein YhaN
MVIKELHVDGFGIYNNFPVNGLTQGVNIISGRNEAGKTTLLRFIRYMMFGSRKQKENKMDALNGGDGGRLIAELSTGEELIIERSGKNKLSFLFSGREHNDEDELHRLLGNASAALYCNVYAFTLDELVSMKSLSGSGVADKIFSVGMGLGNISIAGIEADIRKNIDVIYKPGGRIQQIPELLNEINAMKEEVSKVRKLLPRHKELSSELENLIGELGRLETLRKDKFSDKGRFESFLSCYESISGIISIDRQLNDLPAYCDLPENGLSRLEMLESQKISFQEKLRELENGSAEEKGIDELAGLANSVKFNEMLLAESEKVVYLRAKLSEYTGVVKARNQDEAERIRLAGRIRELLSSINPSWKGEDDARIGGLAIHKAAIRSFRKKKEEVAAKKIAAEALAGSLRVRESSLNISNIAVIVSLVFAISSITAFIYSLFFAGAGLLLASLLVLAGRKSMIKDPATLQVSQEIQKLQSAEDEINEEYTRYLLNELDLPSALPLQDAEEILASLEKVAALKDQISEIHTRQQVQREPLIKEFESVALSLSPLITGQYEGNNIELLAGMILTEYELALKKQDEKNDYENELRRKSREKETIEKKLQDNLDEMALLLKSAGAANQEDFRKKYRQNDEVKNLTNERKLYIRTIESIMGPGKLEEITAFYREHEPGHVKSELEKLSNDIADLDEQIKAAGNRRGGIGSEIKMIEKQSDMASAMTGLETARHKLRNAMTEWLGGRLAIELLSEVREKYEKDKQPAVINNAGRYFNSVTAGRYNRLHVSLDNTGVQVFDEKGMFKTPEQLSRGAREQLLISLRLGFIEEYEKRSEPLPLVIDEALVNFDPDRARRMAAVLHEFASNRQLLMFTCHHQTMELFNDKNINLISL